MPSRTSAGQEAGLAQPGRGVSRLFPAGFLWCSDLSRLRIAGTGRLGQDLPTSGATVT
jgi:hypothetical protein